MDRDKKEMNFHKYLFINNKGKIFVVVDTEKEMFNLKFDLQKEKLDYVLYTRQ